MNTRVMIRSVLLSLIWFTSWAGSLLAQTSLSTSTLTERVVPIESIPSLIDEQWLVLKRSEWDALYAAFQKRTQTPDVGRITEAVYEATLVGTELQSGALELTVQRLDRRPVLLSLDPMTIPVNTLRWRDAQAVWGTTPHGTTVLYLDRSLGTLSGRWSSTGRRLRTSIEFELELAPAEVTRLKLRLPDDKQLRCNAGIVKRVEDSSDSPGWTQWLVELGRVHRCSLIVSTQDESPTEAPVLLTDQTTRFVVKDEGIDLQEDLQIEVLNAPIDSVELSLPRRFQLYSVTYGTDTVLDWRSSIDQGQQRVLIQLPDRVMGPLRRIRLEGFTPLRLDAMFKVPRVLVSGGVFQRGQVQLDIQRPLQLTEFNASGLFQTRAVLDAANAESVAFQQFLPNSQLMIRVGSPVPRIRGRVFSHIDLGTDAWELRSQVAWNSVAGQQFVCRCDIERGWNITAVRLPPGTADAQIVYWNSVPSRNGRSVLTIEFSSALPVGQSRVVLIDASRLRGLASQTLRIPVVHPLRTNELENTLAITAARETLTDSRSSGQGFKVLSPGEVPDYARDSFLWDGVVGTSSDPLLLQSESGFAFRDIRLDSDPETLSASSSVVVTADDDRIDSRLLLQLRPLDVPLSRFQVYLTARGTAPNWAVSGLENVQASFRKLPRSELAARELPEDGELWEVSFSESVIRAFELRAVIESERMPGNPIPLPIVPGVRGFSGTVSLDRNQSRSAEVIADGLQPRDVAEGQEAWDYTSSSARLELRQPSARNEPRIATLHLHSQIVVDEDTHDIHWSRFTIRGRSSTEFRFSLAGPAQLISTRVNGSVSQPVAREGQFLLSNLFEGQENIVEIEYRTPSRSGFLKSKRQIIIPQTNHEIVSFSWQFALPVEYSVIDDFSAIQLVVSPDTRSWMERLFGPLGRKRGQPFFNPFNVSSWQSAFDSTEPPRGEDSRIPWQPATTGWIVWQASGQASPELIELGAIDQRRTSLCAWLAVMITAITGLWIRVVRFRQRLRIGAFWFLLVLAASLLAIPHLGEIAGGAVIGTLMSSLVPRTLIRRLQVVFNRLPARSTTDVDPSGLQAAAPLVGAVLLLTAQATLAQPPATTLPDGPLASDRAATIASVIDPLSVIVPAPDSNRIPSPASDESIVYVHAETLQSIREEVDRFSGRPDDYLLTDAQYRCLLNGNAPVVEATLQVAVLSPASEVTVRLPVNGASLGGPGSCQINGQPATAVRSADGDALIVRLVRTAKSDSLVPQPLTGSDSSRRELDTPVAERDFPVPYRPVESFEIKLTLYPPTAGPQGTEQLTLGIPPIASSVLLIEAGPQHRSIRVENESQSIRFETTNDPLDTTASSTRLAYLGRSRQFSLRWSNSSAAGFETSEWNASERTLAEVSFTAIQYSSIVSLSPVTGSLNELVLSLPPDAIGIKLECPAVLSQSTLKDDAGTRLVIEFDEPRTAAFEASVSYLVPQVQPGARVLIPTPQLLSSMGNLKRRGNRLGVTASPSFLLNQQVADSTGYTMSVEPLSVGERRATYTFDVQAAGILQFELAVKEPVRRIFQNQEGRIRSYGIDWLVTAEIQTDETAAFHHQIEVDPRLEIESISIQEDGAERLIRWERSGKDLTLYLSGKTQGLQNLRLKGHLPLKIGEQTRLPNVVFPQGQIAESTLELFHDSELQVQIVSASPIRAVVDESGTTPEIDVAIGQLDLTVAEEVPVIVVRRQLQTVRASSLLCLWPIDSRQWAFALEMRFDAGSARPGRLRVQVPPALVENLEVDSGSLPSQVVPEADGSRGIVIGPFRDLTSESTLRISSRWEVPDAIQLVAPTLEFSHAPDGPAFAVIGSPEGVDLAENTADEITIDQLPAWSKDSPLLPVPARSVNRYRLPRTESRLRYSLRSNAIAASQTEIALMETELRLESSGHVSGRTRLLPIVGKAASRLDLHWPADLIIQSVFLNGSVWQFQRLDEPGLLRIEFDSRQGVIPEQIEVYWRRTHELPKYFRQQTVEIPVPANERVRHSLVRLAVSGEKQVIIRKGIQSTSPTTFLAERMQALMEICEQQLVFASPREWTWQQLLEARRQARRELLGPMAREWTPEEFDDLSQALEEIDQRIAAIRDPYLEIGRDDPDDDSDDQLYRRVTDLGVAAGVSDSVDGQVQSEIEIWLVDDRIPLATGLAIACPLLAWGVWRLARPKTADWLGAHPGIAWLVIGVIWWGCLSPSVLGFPLIILGLWQLARRKLRPESVSTHIQEPQSVTG